MYVITFIWKDETDNCEFMPVSQKIEQVSEIAQHVYNLFKDEMIGYHIEKVS